MNILFLIYHGFSEASGITKKIKYQIKGLREGGHRVFVCTYAIDDRGHRVRYIDDEPLQDFGTGKWAALRSKWSYDAIVDFARANGVDFVYSRSFHNANPFTINLFKQFRKAGIRSVIEIPTYPYDQEYVGFPFSSRMNLKIDRLFRRQLARQTDAIVTFTDDEKIFGQRTIRISNGVDFDAIPLRHPKRKATDTPFHVLAVAEVHYWHGLDRFIAGLGEYYNKKGTREIVFHVVGGVGPSEMYDSQHAPGFHELIEKYGISTHVVFHGQQFGEELDRWFDECQLAVGSLARHRSGVKSIKTLKNREYAVRGIPFIYSEQDADFDNQPYVMKFPADESPIDIERVLRFAETVDTEPEAIRKTVEPLSWRNQMEKVVSAVYGDEKLPR